VSEPIPVGYQLHVTSWENDADDYGTEIISGLTEADVRFLLSIAKQFTSRHGSGSGLGNQGNSSSVLVKLIEQALTDHPSISDDLRSVWILEGVPDLEDLEELDDDELDDLGGDATEMISTLLGSTSNDCYTCEPNFCRVFSSFEVFWFETPVPDVTSKFK
jgi:hypothetical protein